MIFETHIHLDNQQRYTALQKELEEARKEGITRFLAVSYSLHSAHESVKFAALHPDIYLAVGIHPSEKSTDFSQLEKLLINKKIIAIGEIGLDYHYTNDKEIQKDLFIKQIELANRYQLPILVHSRDAAEDTYRILKEYPAIYGGVMHCFSYSLEMAKLFIELGYYIAFGGTLTFKNAKKTHEVAANIPLDRIVLETDAPYLAPDPYRGQINQAKWIKLVAAKLAELRGITIEEAEKATFDNAIRMLRLDGK